MKTENQPNSAGQSKHEILRADLNGLLPLAKKAYADKRRKECLALSTAILKIDSSNTDARRLQSMIQSDIDQALLQVENLIHDPLWDTEEILRRNANRLLQSVLDIDPNIKEAETLLAQINPVVNRTDASPVRRDPFAGRGVEYRFPPLEITETENASLPNLWVRRALLIILSVLILSVLVFHFWQVRP